MTISDDSTLQRGGPFINRVHRKSLGRSRKRIVFRAGLCLLAVLAIGSAVAASLFYQASTIQSQLAEAVDLAPRLKAQLQAGEDSAAHSTSDSMQALTSGARSTATGPLWKFASAIPVLGPSFGAVAETAVSADDVAARAVAPLISVYGSLDWKTLSPVEGKVDVDQIAEAAPKILAASNTVRLSHERMASINLSNVLPQVAEPIRAATKQLDALSADMGAASSAAELLPAMLGTEDPRTYLVLVQNSAEARATGGIPGALAVLTADAGRIALGEQTSAGALGSFTPPLDVDPQQEALYTKRLGTQMQNVNLTPDFPTAADTAKRMWERSHPGASVDGIIALDPVVLQHLLKATGPVALTDPEVLRLIEGTSLPTDLTSENIVPTVVSDVYREIREPAVQDSYFASVAGQVFAAFADGQGESRNLLSALTTSAKENRLYLWSSRTDEQRVLASTALGGAVDGPDAGGASFGVYFNDGTGAKMDYYATRTVQLIQTCSSNEYGEYKVSITTTNNAPDTAASSLPEYVTGGGSYGVKPGRIRTNYVVYGPPQAFTESASVDGIPVPVSSGAHGQRPVGAVSVELAPGETASLEVTFSGIVQDSEPHLRVTPTVQSSESVIKPLQRETCQ